MDDLQRRHRRSLISTALIAAVAFVVLFALSRVNYLLFHSLAESFAVLVSSGIFVIAWNTRRMSDSAYLKVLGAGSFFVALFLMLHAFAYKGMGVFLRVDADLATQLWIVARAMAAASFLLAGLSIRRSMSARRVMWGFGAGSAIAMASIWVVPVFPVLFVEGVGLTATKVVLEYAICAGFGVGLWLVWRDRNHFEPYIARMLMGSLALAIAAELCFMLYVDVYGIMNFLGHYLALAGYALVYLAIIESTLTEPYHLIFHELARKEADERRIAETLQLAISTAPEQVASILSGHAHRSATSSALVGGDFYDVFSPARDRVAFFVGDICGKGIDAAAATTTVRTALRAFAYSNFEPSDVLARTNEVVARQLPDDKFVTLIYGVMDITTGSLLIASAGHPQPVIRRGDETSLESVAQYPPLGVVTNQAFKPTELCLHDGDQIVLYTDGLIDAGHETDAFEAHRIVQYVAQARREPAEIASGLLEAAVAHAGGALSDDVAVLAVQFAPHS